jgi:two-component system, OmpR family, sensor histidine kinase KdpD
MAGEDGPCPSIRQNISDWKCLLRIFSDGHRPSHLIDEQSRRLNDLTSRLLTTAKLDRGDFQPRCKPVLCSSVVQFVIRSLSSHEAAERIRVTVSPGEAPAWADSKLVAAALMQLLDNAIKYSRPASPIEVGLDSADGRAIVSVRSHGAEIPPSDRERIFERFYRVQACEDGPAGTGLGLSIVKRITDVHQGRVWVESEPIHGTVFFLALPLARSGLAIDAQIYCDSAAASSSERLR